MDMGQAVGERVPEFSGTPMSSPYDSTPHATAVYPAWHWENIKM